MHEGCGSSQTGADVDEDIRRTHSSLLHHPQEGVDRTGEVGDATSWKVGAVVGQIAEPEHAVQPCIPFGGRNVQESGTERFGVVLLVPESPANPVGVLSVTRV